VESSPSKPGLWADSVRARVREASLMATLSSPRATDPPDRLRSALPVIASAVVLLGFLLGGALLLRDQLELGLLLLANR